MVNVRSAAIATGQGSLYVIAIFLITTGFNWLQNLATSVYPWYAGVVMIVVGLLMFIVDHYYQIE
jgi:glucose dehydrogenase